MTEGRLIGHMVVRNEIDRWITATAPALLARCDVVVAHDDGSVDGTPEYLEDIGVLVTRDPRFVFRDDESACRGAGWRSMEEVANPQIGDRIVCVDADEILVGEDELPETSQAYALPVDEVFSFDTDGHPLVRTDGYWGHIQAVRLVQWRPGGTFHPRREGGGSVPSAWAAGAVATKRLRILHLGYARMTDRFLKYERYSTTMAHNPTHVMSILEPPILKRWPGEMPPELRDHAR